MSIKTCFYCGQLDFADRHQNLNRFEAHCPEKGEGPDDARNVCATSFDDAAETYAELSDDDGDYTIVQSNEKFKVAVREDNPLNNHPWRLFLVTGEQIATYTTEELERVEGKNNDKSRPYAPDLVDLDTMAYRLCMATRTVHDYVTRGWLPKPIKIGNVNRWHLCGCRPKPEAPVDRPAPLNNHCACGTFATRDPGPDMLEMVENLKNTSERGQDEQVDEYDEGIDHVAPIQKTDDRAA